jgi:hypothetical protein
MGYRSEVVFACTADAASILFVHAGRHRDLQQLLFADSCEKKLADYDDDRSYMFRWSSIKCYTPAWGRLETLISEIEDELGAEHYKLVRIGEDDDDTEVRGWGFEHICLQRSIEY